jgi:hypothetical protein
MPSLLAAWLLRWALFFALWLALTDTVKGQELAAGAVAAALGAVLATALSPRPPAVPRRLTPRVMARAARGLILDTGIVARALAQRAAGRQVRGSFRAARFRSPADRRGRATAALAEGLGSVRPNRYVVAADLEGETVLVHELQRTDLPLDPLSE